MRSGQPDHKPRAGSRPFRLSLRVPSSLRVNRSEIFVHAGGGEGYQRPIALGVVRIVFVTRARDNSSQFRADAKMSCASARI